jgi:hypothetical protein
VVTCPSVVSDDLVQSVDQTNCERQCFTISKLLCEFPQISCTLLYEIIRHKNAHKRAQNTENDFGLDFLERHHTDGNEYLNHIIHVTGDETWVSFVNADTKG